VSIAAEADLTSLDANGFTLHWTTNDAVATEMLYLALGPLSATAVRLTSLTATRMPNGRTRIEWRTGYEVDNVGFRIYREQDGVRVLITPSTIPGSALVSAGQRLSSYGQPYEWWDTAVPADGRAVRYWLEDVDIRGKRTWHGPTAPVSATDRVPR